MPVIQIDAIDTLFFRDSKTFTKGEDTWADTMFPPYPSVIYGALRSAYFAENIEELDLANKEGDPTRGLIIKNICLKQGEEFYFPYPMDCVIDKETKNIEILKVEEKFLNGKYTNLKGMEDLLQSSFDSAETVKDSLISLTSLKEYLNLEDKSPIAYKKNDFIELEPKIGIARNKNTHSSDEGMLYRVGMNRLSKGFDRNLSIIVDFDFNKENVNIPKNGLMKIGGEGKAVNYKELTVQKLDFTLSDDVKQKISDGKIFKLYLVTPTIFQNGWLPSWLDKDNLKGIIPDSNIEVKLLTAAIGKPISIGGWDIKKGCPKTMRKAVPAGSVYYFELLEGYLSKLHGKSISDKFRDTDYRKQGFGIAYVGAVK